MGDHRHSVAARAPITRPVSSGVGLSLGMLSRDGFTVVESVNEQASARKRQQSVPLSVGGAHGGMEGWRVEFVHAAPFQPRAMRNSTIPAENGEWRIGRCCSAT